MSVVPHNNTVHLVSQGKGGVGKSLAASILAQWLEDRLEDEDRLRKPKCFDLDPVNSTFAHFKALDVTRIDVTTDHAIDLRKFNPVAERIMDEEGPFVIDTGATVFLSWWDYAAQMGILEFFAENNRPVIVHVPIMGGQELLDTLNGLDSICRMMPAATVVPWLNPFHAPIENGKPFEDFKVAQENVDKIRGVIRLDVTAATLRGRALQALMSLNLTFHEAVGTSIERHLLFKVRDNLWKQLDSL